MVQIKTKDQLRQIYKSPKGRTLEKVIHRFEKHSRQFVALSPFLVISSARPDGFADASPRGEGPGFVKIIDDKTLAIPDRTGNNRLDTWSNILGSPKVGLLFLIPGVNETLRVNGIAQIRDDQTLLKLFDVNGKLPTTVLIIEVNEIYLHCAKSLMRSKLWHDDAKIERSQLPTMGKMITDQTSSSCAIESEQDMIKRYKKLLY